MSQVIIDVPEEALVAAGTEPEEFGRQLRTAAAVKWYELGRLTQSGAAEIAGLSRAEFIDALGQLGVSPFQYLPGELEEEMARE